jgi:hypothetical protein
LYLELRNYKPGHDKARQLALNHRGIISFSKSKEILARHGFKIKEKEFYNLHRKEGRLPLSKTEEHELLIGILERNSYYPCYRYEYILEDGVCVARVVRDIFFMSDKQVRLTRRFVSDFMYKTNVTFNTNTLRLPLSVMVGVDNTGSTFPIAFMFITSKSAKSFTFASKQLTNLAFYDCP